MDPMLSINEIALISRKFGCKIQDIYVDVDDNNILIYNRCKQSDSESKEIKILVWIFNKRDHLITYYGSLGPRRYNVDDLLHEINSKPLGLVFQTKRLYSYI